MSLIQSFVTLGVVVLLWSLHSRIAERPVFRWWAWAWTMFGLYLGIGTLALPLSEHWSIGKGALVFLASIAGFLPPLLLVFGARSTLSPDLPTRRGQRIGFALVIAVGVLAVAVSLAWSSITMSYYARLVPRALAMSSALLYCAWVFLLLWRQSASTASLIIAGVCLGGGLLQAVDGLALAGRVAGVTGLGPAIDTIIGWRGLLFWTQLVTVYGTCIGLVLLFVEDYRRAQLALHDSVSLRQEVTGENLALQAEIDVRRRAEDALQRSEEKFAAAFRSNPCAMVMTLFDEGRIVDVNEVLVRQSGYSRDELLGKTSNDLGFWVDARERASVTAELESRGRVATREVRWRKKNGQVVTVLYSADTLEVDGQRCVLSVGEDITARKQAEATHRAVLRALPDWIFVMSTGGIFLDFHVKDSERLAAPPELFLGKHITEVLPPDIAGGLLECFARAMASDDTATLEYSLPDAGGELRFYEARVVLCDVDQVLAIVRDMTDRRRAERQVRALRDELAHVGRVTTLAALTGTLAHEINQPLAAIMTNAQAARRLIAAPVPDLAELRAALTDIVSDNHRAAEVVRRLRTLLRKDTSEYVAVDVNESIRDVLKVVQSDIASRRVTLDIQLASDLPTVLGDRVQLQQVVLNLLMNAFEAIDQAAQADLRVTLRTLADNGSVTVAVTDRGVGLTDEQLPRMFEPFYTTKPDGMGLGLAICQTIMSAHDGSVAVERNQNNTGGTTFSVSLPAIVPAPALTLS